MLNKSMCFFVKNLKIHFMKITIRLTKIILLNHVISGSVSPTDLINTNSAYTTTNATNLDGDNLSLYYDTSDGVQFNGFSSVVLADLVGSNGIVHIVNEVIGLPTVVTFATSNPEFSTLVSALTREDHSTDYVSVLSSNTEIATVTVFAPTKTAFESFFSELELDSINVIPLPILEATLDTHLVYNANLRSEDLTDSMSIATVGTPLNVSLSVGPQLIDSQGRVANITAVDVQAYNGVIHVIDKLVLPDLP